jgi:Bacterial toxin 34
MDFAEQEQKPKQTIAPTHKSFSPEGSEEDLTALGNGVDYSKIPAAFKKPSLFGSLSSLPEAKAQAQSKGSSAPMRIAQSADVGMDDGFWLKALVGAGLAVYEGNKLITIGSPEAVNALYQQVMKTHQNTTQPPQVLKASQRGRQGDPGDTGIRGEAQDLVNQGKAANIKEALDQLMKEAKQANNGKRDKQREQRIKKEQKARETRQSRETKDKPNKPKKKD